MALPVNDSDFKYDGGAYTKFGDDVANHYVPLPTAEYIDPIPKNRELPEQANLVRIYIPPLNDMHKAAQHQPPYYPYTYENNDTYTVEPVEGIHITVTISRYSEGMNTDAVLEGLTNILNLIGKEYRR